MYIPPNKDRLNKLNLDKVFIGDSILFCPLCDWQDVNVAMKPKCPQCGSALHIITVDNSLLELQND